MRNKLVGWLGLVAVLGGLLLTGASSASAAPVSAAKAASVSQVVAKPSVRVGCTFYSVKIHSSGVDDCFLPSGSLTESVYLPNTTTAYTGAYGGMEVWYHECAACTTGTTYYVRLPSSSTNYTLYYGFGITVIQFKYN